MDVISQVLVDDAFGKVLGYLIMILRFNDKAVLERNTTFEFICNFIAFKSLQHA